MHTYDEKVAEMPVNRPGNWTYYRPIFDTDKMFMGQHITCVGRVQGAWIWVIFL